MQAFLRSRLSAFAFAAIVFCCAGAEAAGVRRQPPHRLVERPTPIRQAPAPPVHVTTLGERASASALKALGVPYRWGGASPDAGFDCSGLVSWAYGKLGVELPHSSYALFDLGRPVARSRMKAGDLLFFSGLGHVGIYVGRGRMIHAPYSGRRVEVVSLTRSSYGSRLVRVRRIVG